MQVELDPRDRGSGVLASELSLDGGASWQRYTSRLTVDPGAVAVPLSIRITAAAGITDTVTYIPYMVAGFGPRIGGAIVGLGTLIGSAIIHESNKNLPIGAATYKESYVSIDVRAVDTTASRVLFTVSIDAKGIDWGGGIIGEIGGGRTRLPLAFGKFQKGATEQAVRKAIDLAELERARRTPTEYFRHRAEEFGSGRMAGFA